MTCIIGFTNRMHQKTHLYNFVTNIGNLNRSRGFVMGKPQRVAVTEALACGLPLIWINVIPGQETGNANYVVNGDAGDLSDPMEVLEVMCHWLK